MDENFANSGNKYVNNKQIGDFLNNRIFKYGDSKNWEEIVRDATNEPLNPAYYFKGFEMETLKKANWKDF